MTTAGLHHAGLPLLALDHEYFELAMQEHSWNLDSGPEYHISKNLSSGYTNKTIAMPRRLQQLPWADERTRIYENMTEENAKSPTNCVPGDIYPESLTIETLVPPEFNMNSCDTYAIKDVQGGETSSGYTISSGWSSTFFPCGTYEVREES